MLRLVGKLGNLRRMCQTMVQSLPSLWNVGLLLFLIFFIFAFLGVQLCGQARICAF